MKVLKFGSATLLDAKAIQQVAHLITENKGNIIVLSALKSISDALTTISNYLYNKNTEGAMEEFFVLEKQIKTLADSLYSSPKSKASAAEYLNLLEEYIKSFGDDLFTLFEQRALMAQSELLTTDLIKTLLAEMDLKVEILPALEFMRIDRSEKPDMSYIKEHISPLIKDAKSDVVYLTQGYICRNAYAEIDDLRKGGSDFSATIIGAAINAEEIQIWADSDMKFNNDANAKEKANIIPQLSFDEAAELAYFGSKILHPTCVFPAKMADIPVRMLNVNNPKEKGTLISNASQRGIIKAIGTRTAITSIKLKSGSMLLAHGYLRRVFEVFENYQTSIDMLTSSEIGIAVTIDDTSKLDLIIADLQKLGTVTVQSNLVVFSIVGDQIMEDAKVASKILDAVKSIPVRMISYGGSNLNYSFLVEEKYKEQVLEELNTKLLN